MLVIIVSAAVEVTRSVHLHPSTPAGIAATPGAAMLDVIATRRSSTPYPDGARRALSSKIVVMFQPMSQAGCRKLWRVCRTTGWMERLTVRPAEHVGQVWHVDSAGRNDWLLAVTMSE